MNDRLTALRLFVRVAHTGSLSQAAPELGYSQPSASRVIRELEHDVGASLFHRSTRAVILTEAGAEYLVRTEAILAALEEADAAARGSNGLRGVVRVAVPVSIAIRMMIPHLDAFMTKHPALHIDLVM